MTNAAAYDELMAHVKKGVALEQISGILSWDQEVMMPPDGASARAEQMAVLETLSHGVHSDPQVGEWLEALHGQQLDSVQTANVRLISKNHDRVSKIPVALASELAKTTALAQHQWAKAREAGDFSLFAGALKQIIDLKRQEADCLKTDGQSAYDVLLDGFEPGMTVSVLRPLLESMRPRLMALREKILASGRLGDSLSGQFHLDCQMDLARKLADVVGYRWTSGRLDLSVHPFSSGTRGDARITTRQDQSDPMGCLYSTLHELGHALYEQGLDPDHAFTPAGQHVSMGVHESQSRLWENQIGRSAAFSQWLYPKFVDAFGPDHVQSATHLHQLINTVSTGFIRTEADEVHYNLHVLLRFGLEEDLINGTLDVDDLEEEWNRRFEADFGVAVPDAANGVLQDVHWSVGLFGYFPTYALGNIYAGQLFEKMKADLGSLDERISNGEMSDILRWLRQNVHRAGSLHAPDELMSKVVGEPVSSGPLLDYLEDKYLRLCESPS